MLDAGTGLRAVTPLLGEHPFRGAILLTHLHWDHTQGLPFFRGGDRPDADVRLLLPAQDGPPEQLLERWMGPPFFPITVSGLRGRWEPAMLEEGEHTIEGFTYHREWAQGRELALEFRGRVGETELQGIDLITLDAEGRIQNLDVLMRPVNGIVALRERIAPRMAEYLAQLSAAPQG